MQELQVLILLNLLHGDLRLQIAFLCSPHAALQHAVTDQSSVGNIVTIRRPVNCVQLAVH
jgi:hypothetical protein